MKKKLEYVKKLMDPRWQKKRLEIMQRDNFTCQRCGDTEQTLHVHHRIYEYGKNPWEYGNKVFITLCADCHSQETDDMANAINNLVAHLKLNYFSDDINNLFVALGGYSLASNYGPTDRMEILDRVIGYEDGVVLLEKAFDEIRSKKQNVVGTINGGEVSLG